MALVRATLPTAIPTARQFVADFKKLVRETGSSPALDNLAVTLDQLDAYSNRKPVDVELVVVSSLELEEANRIAAWIGPGFPAGQLLSPPLDAASVSVAGPPVELRVQVRSAQGRAPQKAGTPRPGVLVVVATKPMALDEDQLSALDRGFEDRPHVVLVASTKSAAVPPPAAAAEGTPAEGAPVEGAGEPPPVAAPPPVEAPFVKELEAKARAGSWTCLTHRGLPEMTLQTRLASSPWDSLQDLFRAHSMAGALESLMGVLDMAIDQQQREIRVNKAVTQQKLAKFGPQKGPGAGASPIADLLADLKTRTQRLSQEFERGAAERLQDLLGLPAGALVRDTEALLAGFGDFEMEPKIKTIGLRVPPEFEEKANRLIREKVAKHCGADLVALNDLFRLIGQEIDKTLSQAQNPPIVIQFRYLTDERVRRMLDMYGIFQSAYKGEIPSPGMSEYFASVRKYSMLLVMGLSMFGLASMARQYREYFVPVTVLLVAFGIYQVAVSTRQQRLETMENQLDAARTGMRQEFRRIIGELQKQWSATLNQYLNEQISGALSEIDAGIKEFQGKKGGGDVNPERDRLQRQAQALEASEKRLVASFKTKDALASSISQVRTDFKGLVPGPGGAAGARPGMPMAGGLAGARPPLAGARPGMPGMAGAGAPKGPSIADAKASAMADARAKLEAMKAGKAAPKAGEAEAKPSALAAFQAKMAAAKAGKTEGAPAAPASPPAAEPAAAAPAAPAKEAAPAAAKPSAAEAFQAKMAAMKAAREAGKAGGAAPAPPADAAPAPAPAAAPSPAAAAPETPAPAPAPAAKPSAAEAFQAKMAAMKAAREAGKAGGAAAAPAAAPAAPAAPPVAPAAAPAPPAEPPSETAPAKPSAAAAFQAKMAAMKAAREAAKAGAAPAVAAAAVPAQPPAPVPAETPAPVSSSETPAAAAPAVAEALEEEFEEPTGFEETIALDKPPVIPTQKPE